MAPADLQVRLFDLVSSLARVVDMMCPAVAAHHHQVAYGALRIGQEMQLPPAETYPLMVAGMLHDIGAFSQQSRLDILEFDNCNPGLHCEAGYLLLKEFAPLRRAAKLIRFHHVPWNKGEGATHHTRAVPLHSHILHLADRVAVLIKPGEPALAQKDEIIRRIARKRDEVFEPHMLDAFLQIAERDYFWLELCSHQVEGVLGREGDYGRSVLNMADLVDFSKLLCRIIDFKSAFTATHSSGVAAVAMMLGKLVGFSKQECDLLQIAAFLHDLGKLAIPSEILEKPGRLSEQERHIMKTHVYYTYEVLEPIDSLKVIKEWASLHQERMDGSGYPFSYTHEQLPLGARIMAVADVFTALTEDRPYREGLSREKTSALMNEMDIRGELDGQLVRLLNTHFDILNQVRAQAQQAAVRDYEEFQNHLAHTPLD